MDSLLSFPVGLFHPLQHAGLSRRSPSRRRFAQHFIFPSPQTRLLCTSLSSARVPARTSNGLLLNLHFCVGSELLLAFDASLTNRFEFSRVSDFVE